MQSSGAAGAFIDIPENEDSSHITSNEPTLYAVTAAGEDIPVQIEQSAEEQAYVYEEKPVYEAVKRVCDVVLASLGLIVLSPLMLLVSLAIVIDDPKGGPIFTQMRGGRNDVPFKFYKFRSMIIGADDMKDALQSQNEVDGPIFKMTNDPRVTKIGKFIRKTSIDELPQLWNIICGDMSIVGPRPLPIKESDGCTQYEKHRLDVMPGLTCYWQCGGRSNLGFRDMIRLDFKYIRERSLWTDFKMILCTFGAVIKMVGAE